MALIAALQFLTRLPISARMPNGQKLFRRSTVFFPLAGFVIGLIVAGIGFGLGFLFPFYVNAALLLAVWVLLTGGLHVDGLMDTADGLLSHRSRERMLEIMKDSRVGAMGVLACVLYVLLKAALLAALLNDAGLERFLALALIPVWSRSFMVMAIAGWPYARESGGLGALYRSVRGRHAAAAFLLAAGMTLALFALLPGSGLPLEPLAWLGSFALGTYAAGCWIAAAISRKLGGLTGDVYGALNELLELILLLVAVGYWSLV